MTDLKHRIEDSLAGFKGKDLKQAAIALLGTLGYRSEKILDLENTPEAFLAQFAGGRKLNAAQALRDDWQSIDFVFQTTDAEVAAALPSGQDMLPFDSKVAFDGKNIQSYLFLALELSEPDCRAGERKGRPYTRTELAGVTRAVNRLFDMPALLLLRYGDSLTLSVIRRRIHKRDETRDVLEKVTLIKDIRFTDPHRAHIEILHDLSLSALHEEYYFHNFVGLHEAWEKRLDSYVLNERFYREMEAWYFWALQHDGVKLPRTIAAIRDSEEREKQRANFFIRLLTRLIFCWFLQEKGLIPRDYFRMRKIKELLRDFSPKAGTFYRAFLQNLFFATLNQEPDKREWRKKYKGSRDGHRGITNLYRYEELFTDADAFMAIIRGQIPFVNGGLFDCLDEVFDDAKRPNIRLDDFSEEKDNRLCLPNELFFGEEHEENLDKAYGDEGHGREKVRGLINLLSRYKFTIEENTPLEEDIALDPELLGKVFENLQASINDDTGTTARKALGAFYTPREIVSYMVDESLIAYLQDSLTAGNAKESARKAIEEKLRQLFSASLNGFKTPFTAEETAALITAIDSVKILDPACGSGAFPMGALHRLVDLLQKLDPNNARWKRQKLEQAEAYYEMLRQTNAAKAELEEVESRIEDIKHSFDTRFHALDFARKLYLIEDCIYGVDILPVACQIAKLRFFIALIVDQNVDRKAENLGVRPLPNLETRIVAADTLMPIEKPEQQMDLLDQHVRPLRRELEQVRHDHFNARTPARKAKCRERDAELRAKIAQLLQDNGLPAESAKALASWDPYDQNHHATFFDPEWMFGIPVGRIRVGGAGTLRGNLALINQVRGQMELAGKATEVESGFDVVMGNPPYVRIQTLKQQNPKAVAFYKEHYVSAGKGNYDLYVVFVERGLQLLRASGNLAYILPHKFFNAQYGESLRGLLAKGQHVRHIVHFGDQQVFPGATNYVCLLFLSQSGSDECRFVRVDDLSAWLKAFAGTEKLFPAKSIGTAEWNFAVGRGASLFERLAAMPDKLGDLTDIFVGLQTSADDVFMLEYVEQTKETLRLRSKALGRDILLEKNLLHPVVSGTDVGSFAPLPERQFIVFPYTVENGVDLIPLAKLKKELPLTAAYLIQNRKRLEERENGRLRGQEWHGFIYLKNMTRQGQPKVCVPRLVDVLHAGVDLQGSHYLDNVDVGGVTWKPGHETHSLHLLAALLNSAVLRWFFPKVSAPFRGGYRSANKQFLSLLPIATASPDQESIVQQVVEVLLRANRDFAANPQAKSARDELMLGYFEQMLNGLIYELYFPDELHARKLNIFDLVRDTKIPKLNDLADTSRLRKIFETLYDKDHPVRSALFSLRTLETVRIIEGDG